MDEYAGIEASINDYDERAENFIVNLEKDLLGEELAGVEEFVPPEITKTLVLPESTLTSTETDTTPEASPETVPDLSTVSPVLIVPVIPTEQA